MHVLASSLAVTLGIAHRLYCSPAAYPTHLGSSIMSQVHVLKLLLDLPVNMHIPDYDRIRGDECGSVIGVGTGWLSPLSLG